MTACIFCSIVAEQTPAHVVWSDERFVAFLDHRPLFHGHVLVVPREHHETLGDLPEPLVGPLFGLARRLSRAVEACGAQGSFVAINNRISQSVPHLHVHVVPRKKGDGLKGFFWPRVRYAGDAEMAEVAAKLRSSLEHELRRD